MSRLTSAQVIELGHYLDPRFDPATLTVSQLLGVFGYHNIQYPTQYTKPKLIQVFEEQIKPNVKKFKKERLKKQNSAASDDGIFDGVTGEPLGGTVQPAPLRRSSRRPSRAPSEDIEYEETSPIKPEMVKRRRSSAQPRLGEPSRKSTIRAVVPAVVEESEPEEEEIEIPARKIGRKRKEGEDAASRARRVSGPDSGWEDNNIFQSGAESSSPARPSPVRPRASRKSAPRNSRKSTSAPPQFASSPTRSPYESEGHMHLSPSQETFTPDLPEDLIQLAPNRRKSNNIFLVNKSPTQLPLLAEDEDEYFDDEDKENINLDLPNPTPPDPLQEMKDEIERSETTSSGHTPDEAFALAVSRRIAQGDKSVIRVPPSISRQQSISAISRIVLTLCLLLLTTFGVGYKKESAAIGYCDTGSDTNTALETYKSNLEAIESCNRENRSYLHLPMSETDDLQLCPAPPLLPFLHSISCTPCPNHATCTKHTVTCDHGYILKPHPLLFLLPPSPSPSNIVLDASSSPADVIWKGISATLDGIPGLGSVAFPPSCVKDPKRELHIGVLGKALQSHLALKRGERLCSGEGFTLSYPDNEGGEARQWGMQLEELRVDMKAKTPPHLLHSFDDLFHEAVRQVVQWADVIVTEDSEGKRYLAHRNPNLSWGCTVKVKSREAVYKSRSTLSILVTIIASVLLSKNRIAKRKTENKRIAELVQIALDSLRNQELAHHTDPVTAPALYLSSLQLRDLILQDEHSIAARSRLWNQVEKVVEGNANVRTNLEETSGGDELRVWRWIGANGTPRGTARRQQLFQVPDEQEKVEGDE